MSDRVNTTVKGNTFRDAVKRLLEITPGCTNVQTEHPIGTQPVDIYYEERTSFCKMRVACECKDYGKRLTKDLIGKEIYPRYRPLLDNGLVDAVRIIASLEIGPVARAYVQECGFTFQTVDELESQIIDFRQYMHALRNTFAEDGLEQYYVKPALESGEDLETAIHAWINGSSSQPIAILAGYGMGKTSFARRLAHVLAQHALEHPQGRIPILIPLSEISSVQDLEGLLGKLLTAHHRIASYHFSLFTELNRRGRFVLILDGFDEMKHTLSWAEFKHNFEQLNRLQGPQARVLLLGRPSALISGDEELWVLRGKRRVGDQLYNVPGAAEYITLNLREFSSDQAMDFIRRYAQYRSEVDSALRAHALPFEEVEARIGSIRSDDEMMSLVTRPVQARMLADLAIDPEVQWRSFTRYELYREFVARITEREARKPTRTVFHQEARASFIRRVAWWVWRRSSAPGFNLVELPASVYGPVPSEAAATPEGVRRDLVAGSILEKKTGEAYYFPHRSFVEFLVAEYMCMEAGDPRELEDFSAALTPEVVDFIKDSDHAKRVADWSEDLDEVEGAVSAELLTLIAWGLNRTSAPFPERPRRESTPRNLLVDYFRFVDDETALHDVANYFRRGFLVASDPQSRITCLLALLLIQQVATNDLRAALRKQIVASVLLECLDEIKRLLEYGGRQDIAVDKRNPFIRIFLGAFRPAALDRDNRLTIEVNVPALSEQIQASLSVKWRVAGIPLSLESHFEGVSFTELAGLEKRLALSQDGAFVTSFFRKYPEPSTLIPVTHKAGLKNVPYWKSAQ